MNIEIEHWMNSDGLDLCRECYEDTEEGTVRDFDWVNLNEDFERGLGPICDACQCVMEPE